MKKVKKITAVVAPVLAMSMALTAQGTKKKIKRRKMKINRQKVSQQQNKC